MENVKNINNNVDLSKQILKLKKIENNDLITIFKDFQSNTFLSQFNTSAINAFKEYREYPDTEYNTFGPLLQSDDLLNHYRDIIIGRINKNLTEQEKKDEIFKITKNTAALSMRLIRFRIKLYVVISLGVNSPRENLKVKQEIFNLMMSFSNQRLHLNPETSNIKDITFYSTTNLIKKTLTKWEFKLKDILVPIASTYDVPDVTNNLISLPIMRKLQSIAPIGLKGWESDYYYVIMCLFDPITVSRIFNETQYKQWESIKKEIIELLLYFRVGNLDDLDLSCFLQKNTHIMNIPYIKFLNPDTENKKCSNECFSRFITVSSKFTLQLYFLVYRYSLSVYQENIVSSGVES